MKPRVIIGVTGLNCAGKGELLSVLEKLGFWRYSLSDMIRHALRREGLEATRENLIRFGNRMRAEQGADVLARLVLEEMAADGPELAALDSIRNMAELDYLRRAGSFVLITVTASDELRFERAVARSRGEQYESLESFLAVERKEFTDNPAAQQLDRVVGEAAFQIGNDGTLADLEDKARRLVHSLLETVRAN